MWAQLDELLFGAPSALREALRARRLAVCCLAFVGGILIGECWAPRTAGLLALLALSLGAWLVLWRVARGGQTVALLAACVAAGGALHRAQTAIPGDDISHSVGRRVMVIGRVISEPTTGVRSTRFDLACYRIRAGGLRYTASGVARLSAPPVLRPGFGELVAAWTELKAPSGARNPGELDYAGYLSRRHIGAVGFATVVQPLEDELPVGVRVRDWTLRMRQLVLRQLEATMPGSNPRLYARLLASLVYGVAAAPLPPAIVAPFRKTGTVHVLVVSGAQVSLLIIMLLYILRHWYLHLGWWHLALILPVLLLFVALTGLGPSVRRAAAMTLLCLLLRITRRPYDPYTGLAFAGAALCFWDTSALFDVGLQLSFAACFGVIHFVPREPGRPEDPWTRRYLRPGLQAALGSWLLVAPLLVHYFHILPLIGALANLIVVPLASALLAAGFVATFLAFAAPAVGLSFNYFSRLLIGGMLRSTNVAADAPGAYLEGVQMSVGACVMWFALVLLAVHVVRNWELRPALTRAGAAALLATAVGLCFAGYRALRADLCVTFFSVGDGSCTLVQAPSGRTLLVDAGTYGTGGGRRLAERVILPALATAGVRRLDALVVTHPHRDHLNAIPALLDQIEVGLAVDPFLEHQSAEYEEYLAALERHGVPRKKGRAGAVFELGRGTTCELLAPTDPLLVDTNDDINNNSIVMRLQYGEVSFLLTGDIEAEAERRLVGSGADLRATVLQAPHHGSETSSTPGFIAAVTPKVVVCSAGRLKRYNNPDPEVVKRYQMVGARVFRTDQDGAVTVRTDGKRLTVSTFASGRREVMMSQARKAGGVRGGGGGLRTLEGAAAALTLNGFQERFVLGPRAGELTEGHLLGETGGESMGQLHAHGGVELVSAFQETPDRLQLVTLQQVKVRRHSGVKGRDGLGRLRRLGQGLRDLVRTLADNNCAGGQVAEALAAARAKDGDDAQSVQEGQEVNDADEVADDHIVEADGRAVVADDADVGGALAGGLTVPACLEVHVVAPDDDEGSDQIDHDDQFAGRLIGG